MIIRDVVLKCTAYTQAQILRDSLPQIVFAGRSNVGKSSMINGLLHQKRLAKTSGRPGKTVSINFFLCNDSFYLVDLPGYGFAKISQGERDRVKSLIRAYLMSAERIRLACLLVDSRHGLQPLDLEMVEILLKKEHPILTIFTKSDKLTFSNLNHRISDFKKTLGIQVIPFSTKCAMGHEEILEQMERALKER